MKNFFIKLLATGFYSGYLPLAPGTYGTIVALPFYWILTRYDHNTYLTVTVILILLACYVSHEAGKLFKEVDCQYIVIDEIAGFLVTMFFIPPTISAVIGGFILFRIFDSLKPWPIYQIEQKVPGGTGVVADDIAAGIYANLVLRIILTQFHIL
jgi:phosphatidylglycerophosphatase A